jgi:hypothetical protein
MRRIDAVTSRRKDDIPEDVAQDMEDGGDRRGGHGIVDGTGEAIRREAFDAFCAICQLSVNCEGDRVTLCPRMQEREAWVEAYVGRYGR